MVILIDSIVCNDSMKMPPYKFGASLYSWFITEDEYYRRSELFGVRTRDLQKTRLETQHYLVLRFPAMHMGAESTANFKL